MGVHSDGEEGARGPEKVAPRVGEEGHPDGGPTGVPCSTVASPKACHSPIFIKLKMKPHMLHMIPHMLHIYMYMYT